MNSFMTKCIHLFVLVLLAFPSNTLYCVGGLFVSVVSLYVLSRLSGMLIIDIFLLTLGLHPGVVLIPEVYHDLAQLIVFINKCFFEDLFFQDGCIF